MEKTIQEPGSGAAESLEAVQARIDQACNRCGRSPEEVELLAVSKKITPEGVREIYDCGIRLFGESRVQEAGRKIPLCPGDIDWQMIGHLQTNKVAVAVRLFSTIHSLDSIKVIRAVADAAVSAGRHLAGYVQVNVAGESRKYGIEPQELNEVLEAAAGLQGLDIIGLMTIPPFDPDPEAARGCFRMLRMLRDKAEGECGFAIPGLSMGMSHDFEAAIEEGATCVRVGTALFGKRAPG